MRTSRRLASLLVAIGVQMFFCATAVPASAGMSQINLDVSEGRLLTLNAPAASVFLADPSIADVQVPQPNRIFIFGKKSGRTTLHALSDNGQQIAAYEVVVKPPSAGAQQAVSGVAGAGDVKVAPQDNGLVLQGTAPDADSALTVTNDVKGFAAQNQPVDADALKVGSSQQVMLRVWVGEVARSVTKDLAFNWSAAAFPGLGTLGLQTGRQAFTPPIIGGLPFGSTFSSSGDYGSLIGGVNVHGNGFSLAIDALASEGLVTTLAEPTLMALSGESASFLAGGQFPIPIVQPSTGVTTISIQYEQFGVSLTFTPTVLSPNRISLRVRPEVSEISTTNEVTFAGYTIPSLTIRRAQTTIELGSGQSFAIGGLIQNTTSATVAKYPGLGDLPILGTLFRSNNFQHAETELLIVVTPYLVKPVDDPNRLKLPTDGLSPPNDLDLIFRARLAQGSTAAPVGSPANSVSVLTGPHLAGDAGFDLE